MELIKETGRKLNLKCPWCGYEGKFQKRRIELMSLCIFVLLLFPFIIPGIIYALWYSNQEECPSCRAKVPRDPF
jgi:hypothetical protein